MATPAVMMPEGIADRDQWSRDITYRDQWARWRIRKMLAKVYSLTPNEIVESLPEPIQKLLPDVTNDAINPQNLPELPEFRPKSSLPSKMKVCIVGAGAAGLFTAMIFDWLEEKGKSKELPMLNICYDIFEANGEERLGGRLYTYKFPSTKGYEPGDHDYYDVGAMRFPENPIMKRTFDLFEYLGILKKSSETPDGKLIPYYMKGVNNPTCFNDIQYFGEPPESNRDPYDMNSQHGPPIPIKYLREPKKTLHEAIKVFRDAFLESDEKGWKMLMDADKFSARDFLLLPSLKNFKTLQGSDFFQADQEGDGNPIGGPGFNYNTVEWLETFEGGSGWYSQAFSEVVLESLAFNYPTESLKESKDSEDSKNIDWFCIDGGANVLAHKMAKKIAGHIQYKSPVTSIAWENTSDKDNAGDKDNTGDRDNTGDPHRMIVGVNDAILSDKYAAVFNSTTLGAMQRMNLSAARLNLGTKQAIRTLNYGASCKVGIWFSKAWWILSPYNINRGGLGTTDLPLRVCVYPSYNIHDTHEDPEHPDKNFPAVLLCSYTWEQDASRMGSLISNNSPEGEELLLKVLFDNLARLHASPEVPYQDVYRTIEKTYITHHAYNWYHDPYSAGAFAFFGPSQFKEVWPDLTAPSANGNLFIIGEAASAHHAWVIGALESALRGVYQFISRYAELYPEYKKVMEYLENPGELKPEDKPFLPLPLSFEMQIAKHQVVVSQARAQGLKDPI